MAFAPVVLKRVKLLTGMVLEGGSLAPYGLAKGISSVVDILDGGVFLC